MTGTDGRTVGTGVSGSVRVGTGVSDGGASVGGAVRGTGVTEIEGDAALDPDGDADGLPDGAATCCWDEMTAAPSKSSATSATAAKTVNTVDQRSAGRRPVTGPTGATLVASGGRSSCAVASGSARGGSSTTIQ